MCLIVIDIVGTNICLRSQDSANSGFEVGLAEVLNPGQVLRTHAHKGGTINCTRNIKRTRRQSPENNYVQRRLRGSKYP